MNDTTTRLAALLETLNEMLAEAERLRQEITGEVIRRATQPFWPDRRRTNLPHEPERRQDQP